MADVRLESGDCGRCWPESVGGQNIYFIDDWFLHAPARDFYLDTIGPGFFPETAGAGGSAGTSESTDASNGHVRCFCRDWPLDMPSVAGMLRCWLLLGRPTDHAWGVTFKNPLAHELVGTPLNERLEPTQLFEFAANSPTLFILTWSEAQENSTARCFAAYLILYGVAPLFPGIFARRSRPWLGVWWDHDRTQLIPSSWSLRVG